MLHYTALVTLLAVLFYTYASSRVARARQVCARRGEAGQA